MKTQTTTTTHKTSRQALAQIRNIGNAYATIYDSFLIHNDILVDCNCLSRHLENMKFEKIKPSAEYPFYFGIVIREHGTQSAEGASAEIAISKARESANRFSDDNLCEILFQYSIDGYKVTITTL